MSKRRGSRARPLSRRRRRRPGRRLERLGLSEALTIGWLLGLLFLLVCELAAGICWLVSGWGPAWQLAAEYLLVVSLVLAGASVGLLAGVLWLDRVVPPRLLVWLTWLAAAAPWVVYLSVWLAA